MTDGIYITTIASLYTPESISHKCYTPDEAVALFTQFVDADRKDSVRMYCASVYGEVFYRSDVNVVAMAHAIVDFDNTVRGVNPVTGKYDKSLDRQSLTPTMPEDHFDNLAGIPYFYHSTHSNTAEWSKWRLIIPLHRFAERDEWPFVVQGIIDLLGGPDPNINESCFELSRAFYVPSSPLAYAGARFAGYSYGKGVQHVLSRS